MMVTPRRTRSATRLLLTVAFAAPLVLGLGACGKKGSPKPPPGEESQYSYPQPYPAPATVAPSGNSQGKDDAGPLSIFDDDSRSRTKTY
jgi:hypothetical protein